METGFKIGDFIFHNKLEERKRVVVDIRNGCYCLFSLEEQLVFELNITYVRKAYHLWEATN